MNNNEWLSKEQAIQEIQKFLDCNREIAIEALLYSIETKQVSIKPTPQGALCSFPSQNKQEVVRGVQD